MDANPFDAIADENEPQGCVHRNGDFAQAMVEAYAPGTAKYFARRQRMATAGDGAPVLAQPERGAPCNGCGMCCVVKPCWIGRMLFEVEEGECPALQWTSEGSSCGLMANPAQFMPARVRIEGATRVKEAAKALICAGLGCIPGSEAKERRDRARSHAALKTLGLLKAWREGIATSGAPTSAGN